MPVRFRERDIPTLLKTHHDWITKKLQAIPPTPIIEPPTQIMLQACNQVWRVTYFNSKNRLKLYERIDRELVVMGDISNKEKIIKLLTNWVKAQAKKILPELLKNVSAAIHLHANSVTVKTQKARWGSCSSAGNIQLNYKLIFLPQALAQHVMIHELCHLKQMNHSDKFWHLVSTFDSNWKVHRKALRKGDAYMPMWV